MWELAQRGPSTQRVLADALGVSARNITGLVDGLAATGFVTRQPHPADRRATLVSFTDKGTKAANALRRDRRAFSRLLFEDMPAKQFECFSKGLTHVLDRLREQGVSLDAVRRDSEPG